jgi:hypothetical protein
VSGSRADHAGKGRWTETKTGVRLRWGDDGWDTGLVYCPPQNLSQASPAQHFEPAQLRHQPRIQQSKRLRQFSPAAQQSSSRRSPAQRPPPPHPQQSVLPENHVRHPCSLSPSSHRPLVAFPQQHGLGYIALGYGTCPAPNSPKKKLFTKYFAQLYARWIVSLSSLGVTKPHWEESV